MKVGATNVSGIIILFDFFIYLELYLVIYFFEMGLYKVSNVC
jgi:hypothetical protein